MQSQLEENQSNSGKVQRSKTAERKSTHGKATFRRSRKRLNEIPQSNDEVDSYYEPKYNCEDPQCTQKRPHTHNFRDCKNHAFCKVPDFSATNDIEESTPMPFPIQIGYNKDSDRREDEFQKKLAEYVSVLNKHRKEIKLSDLGLKVKVTDYALAHWYCQIFKLDINNLTQAIPQHLSREQYSRVKEVVGNYVQGIQKEPKPEQALYKSAFIEQYQKRFESKDYPKPQLKDSEATQDGSPSLRNFYKTDRRDHLKMNEYEPLLYSATKDVENGDFLLGEFLDERKKKHKEESTSIIISEPLVPKINSVATPIISQVTSPGIRPLKSTPVTKSLKHNTEQDQKSSHSVISDKTHETKNLDGRNKGKLDRQRMSNILELKVEEETDQNTSELSQSPTSKTFLNIKENQADDRTFTRLTLSPKQARHKSTEPALKKPYNPKTSEQVKFFFAHYEQQALEKKMRHHFIQHEIKQLTNQSEDTREKKDKVERRVAKLEWHELHQNFIENFKENKSEQKQESLNPTSIQQEKVRFDVKSEKSSSLEDKTMQSPISNNKTGKFSQKLLRLNKALQKQRQTGKSVQKTDISMRARREMLFRETMNSNYNIHVRQGRTYSRKFNKQLAEKDKNEGTIFQHFEQFQTYREHAIKELDKTRYGKETFSIVKTKKTQDTQEQKDQLSRTHANLSAPKQDYLKSETQTQKNTGLLSQILRMRVANTQQGQDKNLAQIVQKKHIDLDRLKTIQIQSINKRSHRSVNQSNLQNQMNQICFSQQTIKDNDLRGAEPSIIQNFFTLKQSKLKLESQDTRANSEEQSQRYRLSKSAQRFNKASFMNINQNQANDNTPKATSTLDTQTPKRETLSKYSSRRRTQDGFGFVDKAEQFLNSSSKQRTKNTIDHRSSLRSNIGNIEPVQLESMPTDRNLQDKKKAWYTVKPEEFNVEVKEPKQYFQKELITELPLYEPCPMMQARQNDKNIFKSAEFWLAQGHEKCQKKGQRAGPSHHSVALDYYLSGVKTDPQHYGCIYNTGCCHFYTGKFQNALKWFNLCIKVDPYCPDGYYGKSISCLKLGIQDSINYYNEALQAIEKIDFSEEEKVVQCESSASKGIQSNKYVMQESIHFSKNQIIFVHAMLCKILGFIDKSKTLYKRIHNEIFTNQCSKMKKQIFAVVLISLQKDRRITENVLNEFCDEVTLFNPNDYYDESFTKNLKRLQQDYMGASQKKYMARFFNRLPLFQRINIQSFQQKYIDQMKLIEKNRGELIVLPDSKTVYIVVNGKIVLREHHIGNPSQFNIVQVVKQGQVIGDPELDQGKSLLPFVWGVVQSHSVQIMQMDLDTFRLMWQETRDRELEVSLSHLNLNDFFKQLSKQTMNNIIYEKCKLVRYKPGQLVQPIHSRSPWNIKIFKLYQKAQEQVFEVDQNKMNATQTQLITKKKEQQADFQKHLEKNEKKRENEEISSQLKSNPSVRDNLKTENRKLSDNVRSSQFSSIQNSTGNKSSRYLEKKRTIIMNKKENKLSDELLLNVSDSEDEFECVQSASRPIMIIRKGNAEVKNTKKKYLQKEYDNQMRLRNRGLQQRTSCKPKSQLKVEKEREVEIPITRLGAGAVFGESDCLQIIGYEFLGDIFAGKDGLECLVITEPDLVLAEYERKFLRNMLRNQHHQLIQMTETQEKLLGINPLKDY